MILTDILTNSFIGPQVLSAKHLGCIDSFKSPLYNRRTIGARCDMMPYSTKFSKPNVRCLEASKFDFKFELSPQAYNSLTELNITGLSSRRKISLKLPDSKQNGGSYTGHQRTGNQEIRTFRICSLDFLKEDDAPTEHNMNSNVQENIGKLSLSAKLKSINEDDDQNAPSVPLTCKTVISAAQSFSSPQARFKIDANSIIENNKTRKESLISESRYNDLSAERNIDYNVAEPMKPDHELLCILEPFESNSASLCHSPDSIGFSSNSRLVFQGLDSHANISSTEKTFMDVKGSIQIYQDQVREVRPGCSNRLCEKIEPDKLARISKCASVYVLGHTKARKNTYTQARKTSTGLKPVKMTKNILN